MPTNLPIGIEKQKYIQLEILLLTAFRVYSNLYLLEGHTLKVLKLLNIYTQPSGHQQKLVPILKERPLNTGEEGGGVIRKIWLMTQTKLKLRMIKK